jgi:hypothetical protein
LGFARLDSSGEKEGCDEGEGAARGSEEGDADAALAAGFEQVGGEGDATRADDDFLKSEEGDFGDLFAGFLDGKAFCVFAKGESESGDEELRTRLGGEERYLVGEIGIDVGWGREVKFELFERCVPSIGNPVVLFDVRAFPLAWIGIGCRDWAAGPSEGSGHHSYLRFAEGDYVVRSYQVNA